jgi:hypothetical protein
MNAGQDAAVAELIFFKTKGREESVLGFELRERDVDGFLGVATAACNAWGVIGRWNPTILVNGRGRRFFRKTAGDSDARLRPTGRLVCSHVRLFEFRNTPPLAMEAARSG